MGIFDFLSGQFIDVIHWTDDTRDTMVWRFEREAVTPGSRLNRRHIFSLIRHSHLPTWNACMC